MECYEKQVFQAFFLVHLIEEYVSFFVKKK